MGKRCKTQGVIRNNIEKQNNNKNRIILRKKKVINPQYSCEMNSEYRIL